MTDQINKTTVLEALGDECGLTRQEKKLRLGFIKNINALPPVRFTREDVEKAARRLATHLEGGREFDKMPPTRIELRKWSRERMCNINDATQEDAIEAATAALSAIGEVEHG